eukprot:CAMPEP_0178684546 /NCGR_PEP_ID=MMETSP0699-20121125/2897_1 /TAXON_ID=265572 /ORGANISM="Extubocellulus spinifer, Strain CCMP396" /LENGTH=332 /DNA_ID=CAMNT_0020329219 /DNA_START=44 /DNA_END=1042 /DNA_ORIENTATION=+
MVGKTISAAFRPNSLLSKSYSVLLASQVRLSTSSSVRNTRCVAQFPSSQTRRFSSPTGTTDEDTTSTSTSNTTTSTAPISSTSNDVGELLYQRASSRLAFPRFLLGMTTLHTSYWLWYVIDFTPTINAAAAARNAEIAKAIKNGAADATTSTATAAVDAFSGIDPTVGYLGLGMAILMSLGSAAFPRHLVSEVRTGPNSMGAGSLRVGVHSLPFCTPQTGDMTTAYPPAAVTIDSAVDAEQIFTKHDGDLRKQRGFLALRAEGTRANLLLNIGSDDEVKREDLLLNSILPSGVLAGRKRRKANVDPRKIKQREARQLRRSPTCSTAGQYAWD